MMNPINILILEDNPGDAELLIYQLKKSGIGFTSLLVETRDRYVRALREFIPDIIISDSNLPSFDAVSALELRKEICPQTPFIVLTGSLWLHEEPAVLFREATDCLTKDDLHILPERVIRAVKLSAGSAG